MLIKQELIIKFNTVLNEMKQCKQDFDKLHTDCSFTFTNIADKKQAAIAKEVQEQRSNLETCIQSQREILDQTTKDSQIKLNTIKDEVIAQRQMIDTRIQSYEEKVKTLERMLNVVEAKQASLFEILNNAETTKDDLNSYLNTLNSKKGKIKANLQAYTPKNLDADFKNIVKELDVAITKTSKHLVAISMQKEQYFCKKVE